MSERLELVAASGRIVDVILIDDDDEFGRAGADVIQQVMEQNPDRTVISFATGGTPLPVYRELVRRHQEEGLCFANVHSFMLDEYHGLPPEHENSFVKYITDNLFSKVDIPKPNIHFYEGPVEDHMQICYRYEKAIRELGGIDLMLLGIGRNGHIAFNEPGCRIDSRCRLIRLTEDTRKANARFFSGIDEVPQYALSMGIGNILEAKKILLMATGTNKSDALFNTLRGPVDSEVPASYLQKYERDCTFLIDREAAGELLQYRESMPVAEVN